jgi:hypothetical protein
MRALNNNLIDREHTFGDDLLKLSNIIARLDSDLREAMRFDLKDSLGANEKAKKNDPDNLTAERVEFLMKAFFNLYSSGYFGADGRHFDGKKFRELNFGIKEEK